MTISQTPFLAEVAAGHSGPPIPTPKRAYFQERLRIRVFNFILEKFLIAQKNGLTQAALARRIGKTPDVINRWLGAPSNLQLDSISDLILGIAAEELEPTSFSPLAQMPHNYSHCEELSEAASENGNYNLQRAEIFAVEPPHIPDGALAATASYRQRQPALTSLGEL